MQVQAHSIARKITVSFSISDIAVAEQNEMFVLMLRELGFIEKLSKAALAELEAYLIERTKVL